MEYERMSRLVECQLEDEQWCRVERKENCLELHSRARDDIFMRVEPYEGDGISVSIVSSKTGEASGQAASSMREAIDIMRNYIEVLKFKGVYA